MAQGAAYAPETLQRRWVMGLRLVTSAFILGSLLLLRFHGAAGALSPRWFESGLAVIGLYVFLAVLHHRYTAWPSAGAASLTLHILSDLALTICITLISGGAASPYVFLFLISIINSSFLGGIRLAMIVATFSSVLWGLIVSFPNIDLLSDWFSFPLFNPENAPFSSGQAVRILINTGACYLVAFLSGHLAGQIVQSREALSRSQASLNRMQREMKKAEHLAALGEMAAGLAHELRTPLASMTGALHMLNTSAYSPEDQARLMAIITREMERLHNLSNDFLSFARPSPPRPQVFNLNECISEQVKIFFCSLPKGRRITEKFGNSVNVYFDKDKFIQILWNLMNNALEAGEKRDELTITIETGPDPARPRRAQVTISDNGPGIEGEMLDKIFEPFFSTKARGGGLGLPTVSRLLHEGGGGISAASPKNKGASFTVFLPLA